MMATATAVGVVVRRSLPASARAVHFGCSGCGVDQTLRLHADVKTAPRGVWGSGGPVATYAQAFHLPAGRPDEGGTCDGATGPCLGDCYACAMERRFAAFASGAAANLATLRHVYACDGGRGLRDALTHLVGHSVDHMTRDGMPPTFRWHSDGDLWLGDAASSAAYARAIRAVSDRFGVSHGLRSWIYTRSLGRVRYLVGSDHLAVYVSADSENLARATATSERWGARLAVMANDADHLHAMVGRSVVPCPATARYRVDGHGPSMVTRVDRRRSGMARGDVVRGACDSCALCVDGRASVGFLVHGGAA